jgi:hypothetical protein
MKFFLLIKLFVRPGFALQSFYGCIKIVALFNRSFGWVVARMLSVGVKRISAAIPNASLPRGPSFVWQQKKQKCLATKLQS